MRVNLSLGDISTPFTFFIDFNLNFSSIDKRQLVVPSTSLKRLNQTKEEKIFTSYYNFSLIEDSLRDSTKSFKIDHIVFYYYDNFCSYLNPPLGFAYNIDKRSSIVYQAYIQKKINYPSFFFVYNYSEHGFLYLGGVPDNIQYNQKGFCELGKDQNKWGCILTSILFLEYEFKVGEFAELTYTYDTQMKKSFVDYFKQISSNRKEEKGKMELFPIKMRLGKYIFVIDNQIRRTKNGDYSLLINYNHHRYKLGRDFILTFNLLFDYNSDVIEFYGNKGIEEEEKIIKVNSRNILIYFLFFNITFQCLGIFFLIYTYINKRNLK